MVGIVQGHGTRWVVRGLKDGRSVVDADCLVARCMRHQQRSPESVNARMLVLPPQVLDKRPPKHEAPATDIHFRFPLPLQRLQPVNQQMRDMLSIARRSDGRNGPHRIHLAGCGDRGRAA